MHAPIFDPTGSQTPSHPFDTRQLEQFACPVCRGALQLEDGGRTILCADCRRVYPLLDGIPVLIPDRAVAG
jgi:uncharacterized protein